MFLIMGIQEGQKKLRFDQVEICRCCRQYGHVSVYMYYTYFMLFFIPLFKWNKRYMAVMDCCGATAQLDEQTGRAIALGQVVSIDFGRFRFTHGGWESGWENGSDSWGNHTKTCRYCGFQTSEDFQYCPKCGRTFEG